MWAATAPGLPVAGSQMEVDGGPESLLQFPLTLLQDAAPTPVRVVVVVAADPSNQRLSPESCGITTGVR